MNWCTYLPYISAVAGVLFFKVVPQPKVMSLPFDLTGSVTIGSMIYLTGIVSLHLISSSVSFCSSLICLFFASIFSYQIATKHLGNNGIWVAFAGIFVPTIISSLISTLTSMLA